MAEAVALQQTKAPTRAYLVICIGIAAVSLAAIFIRFAQREGVPSLLIAAARLLLASFILTPITWKRYSAAFRQLDRSAWLLAGTSGFFLALHFATWILSLEHTQVLISVVFVTTGPLWIALLETTFLKAHLGPVVVLGLLLALAGGVLIGISGGIAGDSALGLGSVLALCGALAFAVYIVIGRKLRAQMELLPYIWLVYTCAAIILMLTVLVTHTTVTGYSVQGYLWVWALALVPQLIGHTSFNYAVRYLPATLVGIAGQLEPVASAVLALWIFGEIPPSLQIGGSAIILLGVTLAAVGQVRSK